MSTPIAKVWVLHYLTIHLNYMDWESDSFSKKGKLSKKTENILYTRNMYIHIYTHMLYTWKMKDLLDECITGYK